MQAPTAAVFAWRYVLMALAGAVALYVLLRRDRVPEVTAEKPSRVTRLAPATPSTQPSVAEKAFRALVHTHPSKEVRAVEAMLDAGTVRFATSLDVSGLDPDSPRPRLTSDSLMYAPYERVIVASEAFLTGPLVPPCVRTVALRHEVEHLRDELAGMRLNTLVNEDTTDAEWRSRILRLMHAEWRADIVQNEIELATGCTYMELYGKPEAVRCAAFKQILLTDDFHIPTVVLTWHPFLRTLIEETDCSTLRGPY